MKASGVSANPPPSGASAGIHRANESQRQNPRNNSAPAPKPTRHVKAGSCEAKSRVSRTPDIATFLGALGAILELSWSHLGPL